MLEKGKQVELKIASLAPGGQGVSKDFPIPVFINKAAPGDNLLVEIYDNRRSFAKGELLKVLEPSKDRIEPECKLFKVCGGCQWMHLSYEAQLHWKRDLIEQSLYHIGGQALGKTLTPLLLPTIPSKDQFGYRNKVQLPVRNPNNSSRLLAGYFETNSHKLVNIKHCPIQPSLLDDVLAQIKLLAEEHKITAYDEYSGRGLLRHIQMRINKTHSHVLVTLVLNCQNTNMPSFMKDLALQLMEKFPEVKGVCVNYNTAKGNRILADDTLCLAGEPYIAETLNTTNPDFPAILQEGLKFQLSPNSFFQVNTSQAITLLELIAQELKDHLSQRGASYTQTNIASNDNKVTLLDAYAGVGTIALWLAPFVSQVIAIESNPQAIKDGQTNQALNNLDNVQFHLAKVEEYLPEVIENQSPIQVIVVDPPRQGLDPQVIEAIIKLQPELILYVSCNPVTLARDLRTLLSSPASDLSAEMPDQSPAEDDCLKVSTGYKVEKIIPVDLFPQTYHIESLTVLKRQ